MNAMHLMVEGIGPVSVAELANLGASIASRYCRNDGAEPPPKAEPNPPPISADGGKDVPADQQSDDQLANAEEVVSQLEDQLKQAEATQQRDALQAMLDQLDVKANRLDERMSALEEALAPDNVEKLAELTDTDLGED
jgi:hypothetical protein